MSPVHVIVGEDPRAEAMWARSFAGAVDVYAFPRNVDAFERLTAAEAPIDLVILTPAQRGPFNMTPDQFVARILEGPLGSSRCLSNLHVVVVGAPLARTHPRAMAVSTLDAAVRLVKFGEVEQPAPRQPSVQPPAAGARPMPASTAHDLEGILGGAAFAGGVISRIWDAPDPQVPAAPMAGNVIGGGATARNGGAPVQAAAIPMLAGVPSEPQLFARSTAPEFVAPAVTAPAPIVGGGAAAPMAVGAPGEMIEVGSGALQPARPYQLPNGGGYRGPDMRAGQVHGAAHGMVAAGGQPVPPALSSQVQAMVYGAVGQPNDPLLVWTSSARAQQVAAPVMAEAPVSAPMAAQPAMPAPMPTMPQQVMTVPLDPPAGVYGSAPVAAPAAPAVPVDPFLARAEQHGGSVAFG